MNQHLEAAAQTLKNAGFQVWTTPAKSIRTNATLSQTITLLNGMNLSINHNSSFSKSATGEFVTLVK